MASELKPCPFCGSERAAPIPANKKSTERLFPIVRCMGCFTDVPGKTNDFSLECTTAIERWNTRPTPVAPVSPDATGKCGELETAGYGYVNSLGELEYAAPTASEMRSTPLCLRSQAEKLLASERAEKEKIEAAWLEAEGIISDLKAELAEALRGNRYAQLERIAVQRAEKAEADNAALTARVKELEKERDHWREYSSGQGKLIESGVFVTNDEYVRLTALEAKLAAAEEVAQLVIQAEEDKSGDPNFYILMMQTAYDKARAVLGGKTS